MIKNLQNLVNDLNSFQIQGNLSDENLAQTGLLLWRLGDFANKSLDFVKDDLRKRAVSLRGGQPGSVSFTTPEGVCTVNLQGTEIKIRKDMAADLRATLGEELFTSLFEMETIYKPRATFSDIASSCSPDQQQAIRKTVDVQIRTPRVSFTMTK